MSYDVRLKNDIMSDKQHAERDRQQQKRFVLFFDREKQQKAGYRNHHIVLPVKAHQSRAEIDALDGVEKTI